MVFVATIWIVSSSFYIFHPSFVVELAKLGVQNRARRTTVMRRPYLRLCVAGRHILALNFTTTSMWSESMFAPLRAVTSMTSEKCDREKCDQPVIDLVEGVSIWGVPGLEVVSFVHEVRTFDRHLPACGQFFTFFIQA
jgi:hypothetical protein